MPSYSSFVGWDTVKSDVEIILTQRKQDLVDANAAMKGEICNYLREELRTKNHKVSALRDAIAKKDQAALSLQIQLEKIITELEQAMIQEVEDQERIAIQLEAKEKSLEKIIEKQDQNAKLRDEAQNMAEKNAVDREETYERHFEEKDVMIADLREQLQQDFTASDVVKKTVSNLSRL